MVASAIITSILKSNVHGPLGNALHPRTSQGSTDIDVPARPSGSPRLDCKALRVLYRAMLQTRLLDEKLTALQRQGRIRFHIGSLGEEACIIASAYALRTHDWLFPSYREFGALLLRGMPLKTYLGNMFGNVDDPALGRQMPDHYTGRPYNIGCVSSPIATQLPHAVGFAWSSQARHESTVTAVYFGDGATSSGEFHGALNLAGLFRTPNVFLLRNNGWAISTPTRQQTASTELYKRADTYGVRGVRCDGNDVQATYAAVSQAVERAASGGGPTLVEMMTDRLGGHSTSDDPTVYRPAEQAPVPSADPIYRLRRQLTEDHQWNDKDEDELRQGIMTEIKSAVDEAGRSQAPARESLFDDVYRELPKHLLEQRRELSEQARRDNG